MSQCIDESKYAHVIPLTLHRQSWVIGIKHNPNVEDWGRDVERPAFAYLEVDVYDMDCTDPFCMSGSIKWDGCSNWRGDIHFCGAEDASLFAKIYEVVKPILNSPYE